MNVLVQVFGALLCGVIVDAWVFGLICIMSCQYYLNFPEDDFNTKLLVAGTLLLQLFNLIDIAKMVYFYLVTHFGAMDNLTNATWEWSLYIGLSSLTAFCVQAHYARRVYLLTQSLTVWATVAVSAFCQLLFGLATTLEAFSLPILTELTSVTWLYVTWMSASTACDLIITFIQVLHLHALRTGVRRTNRTINTLIFYILGTGLLISIMTIAELTTFAILGFNFTQVFLKCPMGAVYTVSFLVNLDARRTLRDNRPFGIVAEDSMPISNALGRVRLARTSRISAFRGTAQNAVEMAPCLVGESRPAPLAH